MSWRFRKTFKVLPGVKLNLTRHGLSATVGSAPFSVNVGPRGVYRNVSIPGTGLWNRERVDIHSTQPSGIEPISDDSAIPPPLLPASGTPPASSEIRSASTELLSSESMERLRTLLRDAFEERDALTKEISSATIETDVSKSRYLSWERGFLMKRIRKTSFAARKESFETAVAKLDELKEQLRQTTLATEITIDREQAEPYYRMRDDFAALSGCQKIWNVLAERAIDRIKERSIADTNITRDPVAFSLDHCDLIAWEQHVPHLRNRTGGDMYIYPGFVLYRASKQAFALIDFREVTLTFVSTRFTESGPMPSDAVIVGHTWAKSNKDGSPDRRFQDNYQIPVAHYGELLFTTPDGLDVRYLCSDAALAKRFATAWMIFRTSFSAPGRDQDHAAEQTDEAFSPRQKFVSAFEKYWSCHNDFLNRLITRNPTGKGKLGRQEFDDYMAVAREQIDAANEYLKNSTMQPSAKGKLLRAVGSFAEGCSHFEKCANSGGLNQESFDAYLLAATRYITAISVALRADAE